MNAWINATHNSQAPDNNYINYGTFAGPPLFEDTITELFGKKDVAISNFTPSVLAGGSPSYSAAGLPRAFRSIHQRVLFPAVRMRLVQVHLRSLLPEQMQRVQLVPPVRLM